MDALQKLRPDRDLQCYFFRPSAAATLSQTSATGFTVSGTWRQQFDWAVIEWNRDDVFQHPALRPLPDGDLSGLTLSYDETRSNCIPIDSNLFATVDWPILRLWADDGTGEKVYRIPLLNCATAVEGQYQPASAQITLAGAITPADYVGFSFLEEHYTYQLRQDDTLVYALQQLVAAVQAFSSTMSASLTGTTITLTYSRPSGAAAGANGNRAGVYTYVSGAATEQWDSQWRQFSGGSSPTKWHIILPFGSLTDPVLGKVPATSIRKVRWTYAAELQSGAFQRSEFQAVISNWTVVGSGGTYKVAGPGSRRIEDNSTELTYSGAWTSSAGNFSGGSIQRTTTPNAAVSCTYTASADHQLYVGTRFFDGGASISVVVDGAPTRTIKLQLTGEDVLARVLLGALLAGSHTVAIAQQDVQGAPFYFDFLEIAIPATILPLNSKAGSLALATDWDTDHSIALAPERTAWLIDALGFGGRVNHYVGALWFYEIVFLGQSYASAVITFTGTPDPNLITSISIGRTYDPPSKQTAISHLNLIGDTTVTVAKAFELQINNGYTAIRAVAAANQLTIYAREMGASGNTITLATSASTANLNIAISGPTMSGGVDGAWRTDVTAIPRMNRAARDWHRSFFTALRGYGSDATAAFSMELQNGDPSVSAGIAQRYPSQAPVMLNTPALQTNFSPASTNFWQQVYLDMAQIQTDAGQVPYLQFGEVQWWYFPDDGSGMPFYDAYTTSSFKTQYARDMKVITSNDTDPATVAEEAAFLPTLIGLFTNQISQFVLQTFPGCRFEVLYPVDVNSGRLNAVINYPHSEWTPQKLTCLKTESFTFTYSRNLNSCKNSIGAGVALGFSPSHSSHLIGIGDPNSPWLKETRLSGVAALESVVLFALDQLCLIGYHVPFPQSARRSTRMG